MLFGIVMHRLKIYKIKVSSDGKDVPELFLLMRMNTVASAIVCGLDPVIKWLCLEGHVGGETDK